MHISRLLLLLLAAVVAFYVIASLTGCATTEPQPIEMEYSSL